MIDNSFYFKSNPCYSYALCYDDLRRLYYELGRIREPDQREFVKTNRLDEREFMRFISDLHRIKMIDLLSEPRDPDSNYAYYWCTIVFIKPGNGLWRHEHQLKNDSNDSPE